MNILELLLGQVLDALYFSLFIIHTKRLRGYNNILFIILMILEYIIILNTIEFSLWSYMLYFLISYIILKMIYNKKAQIIDVFVLCIACLTVILVNGLSFLIIMSILNNYILFVVIARLLLFGLLFIFKDRLYRIEKLYIHLWNRNDKVKKKMKSTTFRCMNIVLFNSIFYLINIGILIYNIMRR